MSKPLAEYACCAHPECKRWECLNHALDLPRSLVLLALHCKGWIGLFLREWPLVAIGGLAIISAIWSEAPAVSIRVRTGLLFTFLFGVYFGIRYSLKEQIRL